MVPNHAGLTGHSDGDAVAHAVIDAILGAAAIGNVGSHFPPTDDTWKNADSIELLRASTDVLHGAGWSVGNVTEADGFDAARRRACSPAYARPRRRGLP